MILPQLVEKDQIPQGGIRGPRQLGAGARPLSSPFTGKGLTGPLARQARDPLCL